jgi:hypothetical protein
VCCEECTHCRPFSGSGWDALKVRVVVSELLRSFMASASSASEILRAVEGKLMPTQSGSCNCGVNRRGDAQSRA